MTSDRVVLDDPYPDELMSDNEFAEYLDRLIASPSPKWVLKVYPVGTPKHHVWCNHQGRDPYLGAAECDMCKGLKSEFAEGLTEDQMADQVSRTTTEQQGARTLLLGMMTIEERRAQNLWIKGDPMFSGMKFR